MSEGIREKVVVQITVARMLEIDGTDSMEKDLVKQTLIVDSVENMVESILAVIREGLENPFRFL